MAEKKIFAGTSLSDDALDHIVGGTAGQAEAVEAHLEFNQANAEHSSSDGKDGAPVHQLVGEALDVWGEDDFNVDRSAFADAAQDAFMQAWNDGDGDMTPEEAFHTATDTIRDMMEDAGMSLDNFETDVEMGLEVFTNAMDDGEDPNDAFELAREAIEEANRGNIGLQDDRDN